MNKEKTPKELKKEKKQKKRAAERERTIRRFAQKNTGDEFLYRFMKKFSMNEAMAVEILKAYDIPVTKKQKQVAVAKRKAIRLQKRIHKEKKAERKRIEQERLEAIDCEFAYLAWMAGYEEDLEEEADIHGRQVEQLTLALWDDFDIDGDDLPF